MAASFEADLLDMIEGAPAAPLFARVFEPVEAQGCTVSGMQLYRYDPCNPEPVSHCFTLGVDPALVELVTRDFMGPKGNPVVRSLPKAGLGRLRHVAEITDWDEYLRSPVHHEFAVPAGTHAPGVLVHVSGTGAYMTALGIADEGDWPDPRTRREVEGRFASYMRALDAVVRGAPSSHGAMLPGNVLGIVVAGDGTVLHLPGDRALEGTALLVAGGRLQAAVEGCQLLLDDAMAQALRGGERSMILPGRDRRPHEIDIRAGPTFLERPTILVDCRPLRVRPWSGATLSRVHGLTPREAEVTLDLLAGASVPEIAERRGVLEGTVRVYLRQVFAKTGARGQTHLVAILNGATPDPFPKG